MIPPLTDPPFPFESVRALLRCDGPVTYDGAHVHLDGVELDYVHQERRPKQVPLYIGATGMRMMALAGEIADGAVLLAATATALTDHGTLVPSGGGTLDGTAGALITAGGGGVAGHGEGNGGSTMPGAGCGAPMEGAPREAQGAGDEVEGLVRSQARRAQQRIRGRGPGRRSLRQAGAARGRLLADPARHPGRALARRPGALERFLAERDT